MAKCECHIVAKLNQLVTVPHYMHKMEHIISIVFVFEAKSAAQEPLLINFKMQSKRMGP
jgi:hypothetical protein